jgi:hypothetical protein
VRNALAERFNRRSPRDPITPSDDVAAIKRAECWRDRELADLPDPLTEQEEAELNSYWATWDAEHK